MELQNKEWLFTRGKMCPSPMVPMPKTVQSQELTGLDFFFQHSLEGCPADEVTDAEYAYPQGYYEYKIHKDEQGRTFLKHNEIEYPMDQKGLDMLVAVLNRNGVPQFNGVCGYDYGVDMSGSFYFLNAVYASGEEILSYKRPGFAGWLIPIASFLDSYMECFKQYGASVPKPPADMSWNCSCGKQGLRTKFCGECGRPSPINADGSWNCSCGKKSLRSKFCGACGQKSPLV